MLSAACRVLVGDLLDCYCFCRCYHCTAGVFSYACLVRLYNIVAGHTQGHAIRALYIWGTQTQGNNKVKYLRI